MTQLLKINKGWNLLSFFYNNISINIFKENTNIEEIKSSDNKVYNKKIDDLFNTLKEIKVGAAYWIKSLNDIEIELDGEPNTNSIVMNLKPGWNLIGYPFEHELDINYIPKEILQIKTNKYSYNRILPIEMNTLKYIYPNIGYWIYLEQNLELKLVNPKISLDELDGVKINFLKDDEKDYYKINYLINTKLATVNYIGSDLNLIDKAKNEVDKIISSLERFTFEIYYDNKSLNQLFGININGLKMFSFIENSFEFSDKSTQHLIKLKNKNDQYIIIDIVSNKIVYSTNNLEIVCKLKLISYVKNNEIFKSENFLFDFNFENLFLSEIDLALDNRLIEYSNYNSTYDFGENRFIINFYNNFELTKICLRKKNKVDKTIEVTIYKNDVEEIKEEVIIINNESFELIAKNYLFNIVLHFVGELDVSGPIISDFKESTEYLYWYDFSTLDFEEFKISEFDYNYKSEIEFTEKSKDYIIFNLDVYYEHYYFILVKDMKIKGLINLYCKSYFSNELIKWTISNNSEIKINNSLKIKVKWRGELDKEGYTIQNTEQYEQRNLGKKLNTFKIFKFDNFNIKLHYFIGNSRDSINLKVWKSYKNYLDKLEKIIRKTIDYVSFLNLNFPLKENQIIQNGGSSDYDIYVLNLGSESIKGYTAGDSYDYHTENKHDVITYMTLSNDLDEFWLKSVFFHEFFHAIQGSYDWFDLKWISEGLAVAFEYNLSDFSYLSPKYFLNNFISSKNLSIAYEDNFTVFSPNFTLLVKDTSYKNGFFVINLENIITEEGYLNIENIDLDSVRIESRYNILNLSKVKKIKVNNKDILKLYFSNLNSKSNTFNLFINNLKVINASYAFAGRYYGSFIFFQYLFEQYNIKNVVRLMLDQTVKYDGFSLIDSVIKKLNPNSDFNTEIFNFWCAIEIMSNSERIDDKFILKNAYTLKLYNRNNNDKYLYIDSNINKIEIDDLEQSGCIVLNINYSEYSIVNISILEKNILKLINTKIIYYKGDQVELEEIKLLDDYQININNEITQIKLIIVGKINFPNNNLFTISSIGRK